MSHIRLPKYLTLSHLDWKLAIGSFISWELAELAGSEHPYLGPITLILCLQATIGKSISFTFQRLFGTAIGVLVVAVLYKYFGVHGWSIGLLIIIGSYFCRFLGLNEIVIKQMAISVLLVFVFVIKNEAYAIDRMRDTLIGAIVALVLNLCFFPPTTYPKAKQDFQRLVSDVSGIFRDLEEWFTKGCPNDMGLELLKRNKKILQEVQQTKQEIATTKQNNLITPLFRKRQTEIQVLSKKFKKLEVMCEEYSVLFRLFVEERKQGAIMDQNKQLWEQMEQKFKAEMSRFEISTQ